VWIQIDSATGVPIYRQIARQIEQAVIANVLQPGDRLPSVRELAIELAVNPGTVVKAYEELLQRHVIEQPRGRGTFVRGAPVLPEAERLQHLQQAAVAFAAEAERLGFAPADVLDALRHVLGLDERTPQSPGGSPGRAASANEEEPHAGR